MIRTLKYTLMIAAVLGMIAIWSGSALAQDTAPQGTTAQPTGPGQPAANPESRTDTAQAFDHWMRENPQARQEIMKDPSLLNNQEYLSKHPDLQKFMQAHPDFAAAAAKNPNRLVRRSAHREHVAADRHRDRPEQNKR